MQRFASKKLEPPIQGGSIGKRHDVKKLDNLYNYL